MANDNEISVDEFLNLRKGVVDDKGRIHKAVLPNAAKGVAPASFDKATGKCRFVMSAEVEDRDRDIVRQAGLDLKSFLENPVAPMAHMTRAFPIGQWDNVSQQLSGDTPRTEGDLLPTAGDVDADRLKAHLAAGSIRACSIGFMPKDIKRRPIPDEHTDDDYYYPGYDILTAELWECSPCMIPANPAALAKAAKDFGTAPKEFLEEILDTWTRVSGILVPRKDFEAELAKHVAGKTFSFGERKFVVGENGLATLAPAETKDAPFGAEPTLLSRLAKLFGMGDDATKDPISLQDALKASGITPPLTQNLPETKDATDEVTSDDEIAMLEAEAEHALLGERLSKALAA